MAHGTDSYWTTPDVGTLLRVDAGFSLADADPDATPGYNGGKKAGAADLARDAVRFDQLQERLFAASRSDATTASVLLVLQAMDSAGKGGIVRHVVGSVDPQGVSITAFKKPTPDELARDFLWRVRPHVPPAGFIGVFDRSHYEDVLIARVRSFAQDDEIERRYGAIVDFERELVAAGVRIVKVMLNISRGEQRSRLMRRLDRADKQWKYQPGDVDERVLWPAYMHAYQAMFERTSTDAAPWHVVPANSKWYARLAVQRLLIAALEDIDPQWPAATYDVAHERTRLAAS